MDPEPWLSWDWVSRNTDVLLEATVEHVELTAVALVIGVVVSLPLGVAAAKVRGLAGPVLALSNVLYTVPALAFIVALANARGVVLDRWNVIIPLVAYTLVVLVRNVLVGLRGVPDDVKEAADGMGYGPARRLLAVELPLAVPAVVAGVRVAAVTTVSLVTIGGYIGTGGLGDVLFSEFRTGGRAGTVAAALACVLLAVVVDLVLLALQRAVTPWTRTRAA